MTVRPRIGIAVFLAYWCLAAQTPRPSEVPSGEIRVTLLGTGSGPPVRLDRKGIATLIEAGGERFLVDAGRNLME